MDLYSISNNAGVFSVTSTETVNDVNGNPVTIVSSVEEKTAQEIGEAIAYWQNQQANAVYQLGILQEVQAVIESLAEGATADQASIQASSRSAKQSSSLSGGLSV